MSVVVTFPVTFCAAFVAAFCAPLFEDSLPSPFSSLSDPICDGHCQLLYLDQAPRCEAGGDKTRSDAQKEIQCQSIGSLLAGAMLQNQYYYGDGADVPAK